MARKEIQLRLLAIAIASAAIFACLSTPSHAAAWRPFVNARFGTTTEVPAEWRPQPPPTNGDGREFRAPGGALLRVYGSYSGAGLLGILAEYRNEMADRLRSEGVALSLDTAGRNWFALSGVRDHTIVYYKVVLGCEATHHVNFEYAIGYRLLLDPIVARVASRLRCIDPNSGR